MAFDCPICGQNTAPKAFQPCGPCKYGKQKAKDERIIEARESKKMSAVEYERVGQLFATGVQLVVDPKGSALKNCTSTHLEVVDGFAIVVWLQENAKFNQTAVEGGFGEQDTITDGGDTLTLDFQGSRLSASNAEVWLDLHVQLGGGGAKRSSLAQVMVQSNIGIDDDVLAGAIEAAFALSAQQNCRVLVAKDSAFDGPK